MRFKSLLVLVLAGAGLFAQEKSVTEQYIEEYHETAIREMKNHGVPASITLAQGILESGSGRSYLAQKANNHFGIKCHKDWDGPTVTKDDDAKDECFRKYKDADESFRDHSLFLKYRSRYADLFKEKPTDYKAWAKGLKKAGYATHRRYDKLLIELIENYDLHEYDLEGSDSRVVKKEQNQEVRSNLKVSDNRVEYVIAKEGDTFELIARATEKRVTDLLKYNELNYSAELLPGQIIYIQPKRRKAARGFEEYIVKEEDTMYGIAQQFAIRLEHLYRRNNMKVGEEPKIGQRIQLR